MYKNYTNLGLTTDLCDLIWADKYGLLKVISSSVRSNLHHNFAAGLPGFNLAMRIRHLVETKGF